VGCWRLIAVVCLLAATAARYRPGSKSVSRRRWLRALRKAQQVACAWTNQGASERPSPHCAPLFLAQFFAGLKIKKIRTSAPNLRLTYVAEFLRRRRQNNFAGRSRAGEPAAQNRDRIRRAAAPRSTSSWDQFSVHRGKRGQITRSGENAEIPVKLVQKPNIRNIIGRWADLQP
jgi:hypothetical protein